MKKLILVFGILNNKNDTLNTHLATKISATFAFCLRVNHKILA
ncbi:hypothetical protein [Campylobacter mucosalis]|nr:hypothetical protein [Campylobacter mucosalis]